MGLSAWKQYGASRWALRVNPSSGNLHPTEAYVVHDGRVMHYAPREHLLEVRGVIDAGAWQQAVPAGAFLVGLTSIPWREAWKYGERAFRYCQHDVGHALGAIRFAAALLGWQVRLLPWADADVAAVLGLERDADFEGAEREEPECLAIVTPNGAALAADAVPLVDAVRTARWSGRANRLSAHHVAWPVVDAVAAATRRTHREPPLPAPPAGPSPAGGRSATFVDARGVILGRRSAVAFDPHGALSRAAFAGMLRRLEAPAPPFDVIDWPPQVDLVLFVHRVEDLTPGIYILLRSERAAGSDAPASRAAMRSQFLWEPVDGCPGLFLLLPMDVRQLANRISCDQDIASDGYLAAAMLARFRPALEERGDAFYRRLFWECGLIGQVLYLEAEAAGGRATGIGCFYDDPTHDVLGLAGDDRQSLYHFSIGRPIEDTRLTTAPGYEWER